MKRTPMRRKKPLRQRRAEGADVEREVKPWAATLSSTTLKPIRAGSYSGETTAKPKTTAYRDAALLEMARNRPCLLLVPGICSHRIDTTVAAHSNWPDHGKGGARKADDVFSAWGCHACHSWLDAGPAPARLKRSTFMGAHARQVLAWRQIAADPTEPERFRRAARRALERLHNGEKETTC